MMTRLICGFLMHLQMFPEYEVSLGMINYALHKHQNFKAKSTIPLILCLFKITGAIVSTLGCIYLIVQSETVSKCLITYTGMSIVSQIGKFMALTVTSSDISEEMFAEENHLFRHDEYSEQKNEFLNTQLQNDLDLVKRWWGNNEVSKFEFVFGILMIIIFRILKTIYVVAYFYFCPFLIMLLIELLKYKNPIILE